MAITSLLFRSIIVIPIWILSRDQIDLFEVMFKIILIYINTLALKITILQ